MKKLTKMILKVIPIILIGVILVTANFMFETNRQQSYEQLRILKERQVEIIASFVDSVVQTTGEEYSFNEDHTSGLNKMVENINEQDGVYCYLFNKNHERISDMSRQNKHYTGEAILESLAEGNIEIKSSYEYYGYVETTIGTGEKFLIYWQGIPSGAKDDCEYYIMLTVSEREMIENQAVDICKAMIGVLTIALTFSLYGNIYVKPFIREEENEKK